jgi:hypothetical protein
MNRANGFRLVGRVNGLATLAGGEDMDGIIQLSEPGLSENRANLNQREAEFTKGKLAHVGVNVSDGPDSHQAGR